MGEIQRSLNQLSSVISAGAGLLGKGIAKQVKGKTNKTSSKTPVVETQSAGVSNYTVDISEQMAQKAVTFTNDLIKQKAKYVPQRDAKTGRFVRKAGK